jgi:hypothetical protein
VAGAAGGAKVLHRRTPHQELAKLIDKFFAT